MALVKPSQINFVLKGRLSMSLKFSRAIRIGCFFIQFVMLYRVVFL